MAKSPKHTKNRGFVILGLGQNDIKTLECCAHDKPTGGRYKAQLKNTPNSKQRLSRFIRTMRLNATYGGRPDSQMLQLGKTIVVEAQGITLKCFGSDVITVISSPSKRVLAELKFVQHPRSIPRRSTPLRFVTAGRFIAQRKST